MLDLLPQELFHDPNTTFLDPACKSGVFLREIAKRLLVGWRTKSPIYSSGWTISSTSSFLALPSPN